MSRESWNCRPKRAERPARPRNATTVVDRSFEQILDESAGRSLMCGLLLSGQLAMAGGQVGLALLLVLRCEGEMGRTVVWLLLENELEEAQAVGRVTVLEQ